MAKTRLNNDKRDILSRLAMDVVRKTPIDMAITDRLEKAIKELNKTHDNQVAEARRIVQKACPEADLKVLRRYGLVNKYTNLSFIDLDTRDVVCVDLLSRTVFWANNPDADSSDYTKAVSKEENRIEAAVGHGHEGRRYEASPKLVYSQLVFKEAIAEYNVASEADYKIKTTILQDFEALISSSRTFEDVVEVWPEAKTVAGEIVASGQQISIMSTDAINRIRNNMLSRGVDINTEGSN